MIDWLSEWSPTQGRMTYNENLLSLSEPLLEQHKTVFVQMILITTYLPTGNCSMEWIIASGIPISWIP